MLDIKTLSNYSFFYGLSSRKGVGHIFNEYMGCNRDDVVPVGVSHGIDFEHCHHPMDVYSAEPIYWAYNTRIFERSKNIKPCLLMAHPWSILVNENNLIEGIGTLIIGPPPGRANDQLLYNKVKNDITSDWSILVKGGVKESMQFWKEKGVKPITAGNDNNDRFFHDLFYLLSSYRDIVACTFSSAVIFAASINKKIVFVEGYQYTSYDTITCLAELNFDSVYSKFVVSEFINANKNDVSELAREILGFDLLSQKDRVHQDYLELLKSLDSPIYCRKMYPKKILRLKINLAKFFSKPNLINKSSIELISVFKDKALNDKKNVMVRSIDEISIWLNGVNENNLSNYFVPYKKGVTVPGKAVDRY